MKALDTLSIPQNAPPAPQARAARKPARRQSDVGLKVLVVDDDPDDLAIVANVLKLNLNVTDYRCATDGEDALKLLQDGDFPPDLVFLDLSMPRMGGLELLRRMRALPDCAATPVFVVTTSGWARDVKSALSGAAVGYIIKPSRVAELEERLNRAIEDVLRGLSGGSADKREPKPKRDL